MLPTSPACMRCDVELARTIARQHPDYVSDATALLTAEPALAKTQRDVMTALFCLPEQDEDLALQIAELLLSHGADPAFRNLERATGSDLAERNGGRSRSIAERRIAGKPR